MTDRQLWVERTYGPSWDDRPVMAGVVRSRTAASWQRNSQKAPVPQRRLRGSPDARFGSKLLCRQRRQETFILHKLMSGRMLVEAEVAAKRAFRHPAATKVEPTIR